MERQARDIFDHWIKIRLFKFKLSILNYITKVKVCIMSNLKSIFNILNV